MLMEPESFKTTTSPEAFMIDAFANPHPSACTEVNSSIVGQSATSVMSRVLISPAMFDEAKKVLNPVQVPTLN
jgi:hypothetical protein